MDALDRPTSRPPYLLHRDAFGRTRRIPLLGALTAGRAPGCGLIVDDPAVSALQFMVLPDPSVPSADAPSRAWLLADLGSRNGTYVNRSRVQRPTRLRHEDRIQFGRTHSIVVFLRDDADTGPEG